ACLFPPDRERGVFWKKSLTYLENDMAHYLTREGVLPILIPEVGDRVEQYLDEVDGLVLQGGADLAPGSYGEDGIEDGRWPGDPRRDAYELDVLRRAAHRKLPIYGICRGAQLLNVWRGGTLYQDLVTQTSTEVVHQEHEAYDAVHHPVECVEGGLLASLYGATTLTVNSVHHQGVKTLGAGLAVEARAPDGLVEAFVAEDLDDQYVLGVQWHPEFSPTLGDRVADPAPLLDHFLAAVRARA
ncbi:MAG: gamma-glutamyl-gamma-aminobutyrate hydrolase family protein, partial [Myxococcota bacterium]